MTQIKELQSTIEKELLFHIISNMKEANLSMSQAQALAADYYALLPAINEDDLIQKLKLLAMKYAQAWKVFKKIGIPYIEEKKQQLLSQVHQAIGNNDIDTALKLTKETIVYG